MDFFFQRERIENFCTEVFIRAGLNREDAARSAEVLVEADARGIGSHGVGRMTRYVKGLLSGQMIPGALEEFRSSTANTFVIDAGGGMGIPVSCRAMRRVIDMADAGGLALGCVCNSNHFGIASHYAMMALEYDMIGIAMTNTAALGVPTFGREPMFGTNPIAVAVPADKERAFVLDMASTTVTRGKLELYQRLGKTLPAGWAVDSTGGNAVDAGKILDDMLLGRGGLLPLGGFGEAFGGHKGYGIAVLVDIFCALLSGAPFGREVFDTPETSARVSHCFGAVKIAAFRETGKFRADMDRMLSALRSSPHTESADRVRFAGEKEFEAETRSREMGIRVDGKAVEALNQLAEKFRLEPVKGIKV